MIRIMYDSRGLNALLAQIKARAGDLRPALTKIAGQMMDSTEENFEKQGRPRWPDLADSTKKARKRKGKWPGKMLQVSGQLAASVSSRVEENAAIVGTNKVYAGIHQFGGKAGRKHAVELPARPFLHITKEDVSQAEKTLLNYLMRLKI